MRDLFKEMFLTRRFKPSQGRLVRQLTMFGVWAVFLSAAYKFFEMPFVNYPILGNTESRFGVAVLIGLVGMWFGYRLVNWPSFADFLVSVESEMVKVSWPSKAELYSSTIVVLVMFLLLGLLIFGFDMIWVWVFTRIGVLTY